MWASSARERGRVKDCAFRMGAWASLRVKPDQAGGSKSNVGSSGLDQRQCQFLRRWDKTEREAERTPPD